MAASAVTVSLDQSTAQNTLGSGIDTLALLENLIGSGFNDTLTGDSIDNIIQGGEGDDALYGGAGNDIIMGGVGNDSVVGGFGSDTLEGGDGDDTIDSSAGDATSEWRGDIVSPGLGSNLIIGNAEAYAIHLGGLQLRYDNLAFVGGITVTVNQDGSGTTVSGDFRVIVLLTTLWERKRMTSSLVAGPLRKFLREVQAMTTLAVAMPPILAMTMHHILVEVCVELLLI
jgi:Ca2+-binding RTX toxin-like protein